MQYLKYIVIICAAAVLRLLSKDDDFLSTTYIIKSLGILLLVAIGIVMVVRDVKQPKSNPEQVMDLSFSDLNLQLDGLPPINFNSVETLPGFEARAAFTVNSASVFKEDVDMVPTSSASVRTSSTSASLCQCLFSTWTARVSSAC